MDVPGDTVTEHKIEAGHELRMEVDWGKEVFITVREGSAEIFGTNLELGEKTRISGQKVAIFSWKGVTLTLDGTPDIIYSSEDTPMTQYLNVHDTLDARRTASKNSGGQGPRVLIAGPTDSGKSSLCKVILNYAVRSGWTPTFVDLDLGQGSITVPGCVSATPVETPIDVEAGMPDDAPLVYYTGHVSPSENPALYRNAVERLAAVLESRAQADAGVRSSGMVINSMGWIEDLGYDLLKHSIMTVKADVVLVVGQERLYSQLTSELTKEPQARKVEVVKLTKSAGVVTRSKELRSAARKVRVEEYFYGVNKELAPVSQTAKIDAMAVYRVGGGPKAPTTALPIGATSVADPLKVTRVANFRDLLFTLVAVSHAPSADLLLSFNVAGFIYIQDVDVEKGIVTYLAPCPGQVPGKFFLAGTFKTYLE